MRSRLPLSLLVLTTASLGFFAACGGGPGPRPTPRPTPTPTPVPTATPTPAPTLPPCIPIPTPTKFTAAPFRTSGIVFAVVGAQWGRTHWADLDHPVVTDTNGLTCQNADCSEVLIFLGAHPLTMKGGFTVTGDNEARVRIRYTGTTITNVEKLNEGMDCTPGPSPTPKPTGIPGPTPPPTPPPAGPSWPGDIDAACRRQGADGMFRARVDAAVDAAERAGVVRFPWVGDEVALFTAINPYIYQQRLATGVYGTEELAIQDLTGSTFSENYDLLLADHSRRSGPGAYRSTCAPATRSSPVPGATPGPMPTPTPGGTPVPTPSPSLPPVAGCPFTQMDFLAHGRWFNLHSAQGPGNRSNQDVTPQVCLRDKCAEIGFPGRECCPSGAEGDPNRGKCDVEMSRPFWTIHGQFCGAGGEHGLGDNELRNCTVGSGAIRVCSEGSSLCAEVNFSH